MPISIPISATADDKAFQKIADRYEKWGNTTGKKVGAEFAKSMEDAASKADPKAVEKFEKAYGRVADTMGKVRAEEAKLQELRDKGASNARLISQSEALERARRAEIRATREAAAAYRDFEEAAASGGRNGSESFLNGLRESIAGAGTTGQDAAQEFVGGFAGSSMLLRLGSAVGPIGLALAGVGTLGVAAGKVLASAIADGMATIQMQDVFQSRMGLDDSSMASFAHAAGQAWANNFGQSMADNLQVAQDALRAGLIDSDASDAEVQLVIEQLQGLAVVTDATAGELSRSMTTMIRSGLAQSASEASDIITAGFQAGLDVSGDWLDTLNEYSTQFRKLGLTADDTLTLLQQGLQGGARDTDLVADSLKEFSIRAVGGSKSTREGFEALGFNADDMASRISAGGDTAKVAFDAVLDALRRVDDPMQQALIWQRLFGTQWEDMGSAVNNLDLDPAKRQFTDLQGTSERSTKTASDNFASEWDSAMNSVQQRLSEMETWLADWFTRLPIIKGLPGWIKSLAGEPTGGVSGSTNPNHQGTPIAPSPNGGIVPLSTGTIQGNGTFLDNLLDPTPGEAAPPELTAGMPGGTPADAPVPGAQTPILTDAEAEASKAAAKPNIPLSQYSLDSIPLGQFAGEGGIQLPGRKIESHAGAGSYQVDPQKVFDADSQEIAARQSLEDARRHVLEVQADNDHTESEMQAAKNRALLAERSYVKAQQDVVDAQQGTWEKAEKTAKGFSDGMEGISAALDSDLGISDGLPGIAENLVKFLGSLAFAPVVGALQGVQVGLGVKPGSAGSGVAGMIGSALGLGGSSPQSQATTGGVQSVGGRSAPIAAQPGESARDFAHRAMMPFWESQGLTVGDHAADQYGEHQNGALDIMVPSIEAGNQVLQQVLSDPNVYGAIFNNQTYGYGHGPSPQDYAGGHTGDPNQDHTNHVHALYRPGDPNNINPNGVAPAGLGPAGGGISGGATPVFVVNMPGAGLGGGGGGVLGPKPGPGGTDWDRIAQLESSGNWQDNNSGGHTTSSGAPRGGLQITDGTWNAYGGSEFGPTANAATPEQQQEIANRILYGTPSQAGQGSAAWETWPQSGLPAVAAGGRGQHGGGPGVPGGGPAVVPPPGIVSDAPPWYGGSGGGGTGVVGPGLGGPPAAGPFGGPAAPGLVGPGVVGPAVGGSGGGGVGPSFGAPSSVQGGRELGAGTPASGGLGFSGGIIGAAGGAITSAIGAAGAAGTMGMDGGAGGAMASAAAQIGIQEGMRAIAYAGQLAGIGVSGLMETFSLNDSALADPGKSWLGRIAMGVAGARPALPNSAGASGGTENKDMAESGKGGEPPAPPGSVDPNKVPGSNGGAGSEGQSGANGNVDNSVTINHTSNNIANQQQAATLGDYVSSSQIQRVGG